MNIYEYRELVLKSENGSLTEYPAELHAIMGMNGEAGECIDMIKKNLFQGHEFDEEEFLNELGDVCWYTVLLADKLGLDFDRLTAEVERDDIKLAYDQKETKGLEYILEINKQCGNLVDVFKSMERSKVSSMIKGLRSIRSILYYVNNIAVIFDKTLEDIFEINKNKIETRYPNGFSVDDSINRTDNY